MDAIEMIKNRINGNDNVSYTNLLDFNNAAISKPKALLIPHGTIAKTIMNVRSGGYEKDKYLSKSAHTGAIYLHAEFIIMDGPFSRRRIFQNIGVIGNNKVGDNDVFGTRGRSLLRGLIESAKGIIPNDESETSQNARKIDNFGELNGMICVVKIGIDKDKSGKFEDRNTIICAVTPEKKEYQVFMNGVDVSDVRDGNQLTQNNNVWY